MHDMQAKAMVQVLLQYEIPSDCNIFSMVANQDNWQAVVTNKPQTW